MAFSCLGHEILEGESAGAEAVAIMGFYQTQSAKELSTPRDPIAQNTLSQEEEETPRPSAASAGRIVVYGDSNCADNSHMQKGSHKFTSTIQQQTNFFL